MWKSILSTGKSYMALSLLGLLVFGREGSYPIASITNFTFLMRKEKGQCILVIRFKSVCIYL